MIPVNEPKFGSREKELVLECLETGWVSSDGPFITKFEELFSSFVGVKYGAAVCNGTAALEAALFGLGVGPGDEVIMPTFTIISCPVAALRLGAKPVLVDINPELWTMDPGLVEKVVTRRTKVIMPVHIYGHPVDMDPLLEIGRKHGIAILEDAAEAHGAEYKGRKCGAMGAASAFSFYANKIVTTGEGGMVLTDDPAVAARARSYRNLCFKPERRFFHTEIGYNFRMTNLQAALGIAQTERIDESIALKRRLGEYYRTKLASVPGLRFASEKPWAKSVYWMYAIEIDKATGLTAARVMELLGKRGIGTRPFFLGMHEQPAFHSMGLFAGEHYPNAEHAYRQGLYLPSGMTLTEAQIDIVCGELGGIMTKGA
jgi:perosamine synthetase